MTDRSKEAKLVDPGVLADKSFNFGLKTAEPPDERASRLRREEAEAEHMLRAEAAEDAHKLRIAPIVHIFVVAVVAVAFLASAYIAVAKDPKTGLPDKAVGIIMAILAAAVGYMTGKGSK